MRPIESTRVLIPQFSIRWLLALTTVCAGVFSVFGLAYRGSLWARGVSVAIISMAIVFAAHACVFALVWGVSVVSAGVHRRLGSSGRSPFAGQPIASRPNDGHTADDKETGASPIILE